MVVAIHLPAKHSPRQEWRGFVVREGMWRSFLLPEHAQLIRVRPVDRPMATGHQLRCAEPCSGVFGLGVMFALEAALLAEISPLLTRFDRGGRQWSTTTFHRFDLRGRLLLIGFGCRR